MAGDDKRKTEKTERARLDTGGKTDRIPPGKLPMPPGKKGGGVPERTMPVQPLKPPSIPPGAAKPGPSTIKAPTADLAFADGKPRSGRRPAAGPASTRRPRGPQVDWNKEIEEYWGRRRLFAWTYGLLLALATYYVIHTLNQKYGDFWPLFATWCFAGVIMLVGFIGVVVYQFIND